jgi:hypothetical protein
MLTSSLKGRRSLEYRLRDADQLKVEAMNLLASLSESLTTGKLGPIQRCYAES